MADRGGSWGNPRTTTPQWRRLRKLILERDGYICYLDGLPGADEVDHVDGNHDNNDPSNLRAIHDNPCHRRKSSAEGNAARQRLARPPEPHPGLIVGDGPQFVTLPAGTRLRRPGNIPPG